MSYPYLAALTPAQRITARVADVDRAVAAGYDADDVAARREVCENAMYRAARADWTLAPLATREAARLGLDMGAAADRVESFERYEEERNS